MKHFLLFIILSILIQNSYSQTSFEINIDDNYSYFIPINSFNVNGSYIASYNTDSMFNHLKRDSYLNKIDYNGNTLINKQIKSGHGSAIFFIKQTSDFKYFCIGSIINDSTNLSDLWVLEIDSLFNTLWEKQYNFKNNYNFNIESVKFDSQNNYIVAGNIDSAYTINKAFLIRLNQSGDTLLTKSIQSANYESNIRIIERNGGYVMSNSSREFYTLNYNFEPETITEVSTIDFLSGWSDLIRLSNKKILFTGIKPFMTNGSQDNDLGVVMLDTLFNKIKDTNFGKYDTSDYPSYFKNIDFIDKNNIYYGGTSNIEFWDNHFFPVVPSWYILNKLDSNLNLKWQKFYGGDVSYFLKSILATQDGGCLMMGSKYDYQTQTNNNTLHILKVDNNGLITNIAENSGIKAYNAILFPNPATTKINIRVVDNYQNSTIKITNISGKQIMSEQIEGTAKQLNIESLKSGIYLYNILNNNEIIESGKFVKE